MAYWIVAFLGLAACGIDELRVELEAESLDGDVHPIAVVSSRT
jgi:hypothetical protein